MTAVHVPAEYYMCIFHFEFNEIRLCISPEGVLTGNVGIRTDGWDIMREGYGDNFLDMIRAFGQAYADANGINGEVTLVQAYSMQYGQRIVYQIPDPE